MIRLPPRKYKYKTRLCKHYTTMGFCSMQDKCLFAHDEDQLRQPKDSLNIQPIPFLPVSNYKTQMCKYYARGYCKNENDCKYAHGQQDIHLMQIIEGQDYQKIPSISYQYKNQQNPKVLLIPFNPYTRTFHIYNILQEFKQQIIQYPLLILQINKIDSLLMFNRYKDVQFYLKRIFRKLPDQYTIRCFQQAYSKLILLWP